MPTPLGKTLKKYRKQKNYSITELAEKLQVSTGFISNLETGKSDSFHLDLLNKLIEELDIPLNEVSIFKNFIFRDIETSQGNITINIESTSKLDKDLLLANIEKLISAYLKVSNTCSNYDLVEKLTENLISQINIVELAMKSDNQ